MVQTEPHSDNTREFHMHPSIDCNWWVEVEDRQRRAVDLNMHISGVDLGRHLLRVVEEEELYCCCSAIESLLLCYCVSTERRTCRIRQRTRENWQQNDENGLLYLSSSEPDRADVMTVIKRCCVWWKTVILKLAYADARPFLLLP